MEIFTKEISEQQSFCISGGVGLSISNEVGRATICTSDFIMLSLVVVPNFSLPFVTFLGPAAVGPHPAVPVLHLWSSWMLGHEGGRVSIHVARTPRDRVILQSLTPSTCGVQVWLGLVQDQPKDDLAFSNL